ncbi:MAG: pyruvate formate lyase family protein [Peptococcaceae bacterium]|nr:pyruvate formate lyase family protein [Peptococcaceae bacterium]
MYAVSREMSGLTDLEERIQDGRQLSSPRERINRIMDNRFYGKKPRVDIQRAVLFTESMRTTEAYPQILRIAMAIQYVLEHIAVEIQDDELIVGTAGGPGRYCMLYPETRGGQFPRDLPKILKSEGKAGYAMTQEEVDTVLRDIVPYWKGKTSHELYLNMLPKDTRRVIYGDDEYTTQGLIFDEANNAHTLSWTGSYEKVINEGLESIIRELEEKKANIEANLFDNQMDKIYYLDAAIMVCKATIAFAHRYADKAAEMAAVEKDPVRKKELQIIAENCRQVPEHPARNFYEAVQSQWFLQVGYRIENMNGGGVGLGRLDQYLYPIYQAGLDDGSLTEEKALEILECMFIKVGEVVPYQGKSTAGGHEGYTHFEALSLGGLTADGRDATNSLTYLILRSKKEFPFQYPDVSMRVHANTPNKLLRAAAEVVRVGYGCPKFFNDEEFINHYLAAGVPLHIARTYAASGCCGGRLPDYETYLVAVCNLNITAVLEMAINDGWVHFGDNKYEKFIEMPISADQIQNMDDLMVNLESAFTFFVRHIIKRTGTLEQSNALKLACPFTSALSEAGRINMKDLHQPCDKDYGLYIDNGAVNVIGIGTMVESLSAIDKFVFEEKLFTLKELKAAINANFDGYEPMRQKLLHAPKFANGDEHALNLARRFDAMMQNVIIRHRTMHGGKKHLKFVPVASHVALGKKTIATPNGRKAGEPLSEGISPTQGTDENGPITTLNAVAAINSHAHDLTMQRLLNMKLSPSFMEGEEGIRNFIQIIRTFVDLKLWHIQFNVVHRETLIEAQKQPDKYRNLVVRVAGYCAYFTDLSENLQNEIINRTEHTSMCTE